MARLTSSNEKFTLNNLKILLVEDEPDTVDLFTFILEEAGAKVMSVMSIAEVIKELSNFQPDILISDIRLADGDGYTLLRMVRSREAELGGFLPAIAITGSTGDVECKEAQEAGFQRLVSKPVDPDELVEAVARLISK